jgi:dienelactone hydrolase
VDSANTTVDDELFYLTSGSVNATGKLTAEGFVVFAGAIVNEKTSVKSLSTGMQKQRQKLFDSAKVDNLVTIEDILFSSSSAAADFILGYSVSGPRAWKTKDGISLKELEDSDTK